MIHLISIHGPVWHFLENYVYSMPPRLARQRTKPMQVICVGFPRTGTESLQTALLELGYDHTHHGWDIIFEEPCYAEEWAKLARRKFSPSADGDGDCTITAEDFDRVMGHCTAVTDAAGSVFASELIRAYPDAKVVINDRPNFESWRRSMENTVIKVYETDWKFWLMSWFSKDFFWAWHVYYRIMWPGLFQCLDGHVGVAVRRRGKWVHREHHDMVRGMVPKDRLLEWKVQDGWEPLCKFLGKETPSTPFPQKNDPASYSGREQQIATAWALNSLKNFTLLLAVVALLTTVLWKTL